MSAVEAEVIAPVNSETVADIIDQMFVIREERQTISARDKELVEAWSILENKLLAKLDLEKATRVSSSVGTAVITEQILPTVEDWDEVNGYIMTNDALHILQRRMSTAAYRELLEAGIQIPGVRPLIKRSISLRAT